MLHGVFGVFVSGQVLVNVSTAKHQRGLGKEISGVVAALFGGVLFGFVHGVERLEVYLFAGNPERFSIAVFEKGVDLAIVAVEDVVIVRHWLEWG